MTALAWHAACCLTGTLLPQIKELFSLDQRQDLTPALPEELLSGLLTELGRLHWCKCVPHAAKRHVNRMGSRHDDAEMTGLPFCRAVRCDPRPALMIDLDVDTANSGLVSFAEIEHMARAIAAQERLALLTPEDGCAPC